MSELVWRWYWVLSEYLPSLPQSSIPSFICLLTMTTSPYSPESCLKQVLSLTWREMVFGDGWRTLKGQHSIQPIDSDISWPYSNWFHDPNAVIVCILRNFMWICGYTSMRHQQPWNILVYQIASAAKPAGSSSWPPPFVWTNSREGKHYLQFCRGFASICYL